MENTCPRHGINAVLVDVEEISPLSGRGGDQEGFTYKLL